MKCMRLAGATLAASLAITVGAFAASADDGLGFYVKGGVALGWASADSTVESFVGGSVSNGVNAGFDIAGGFRLMPAVAVEGEFFYVTGGDIQVNGLAIPTVETSSYAFTGNVKLYPFMFSSTDATGLLQPYLAAGIGGGSGELAGALVPGALAGSQGSFLARFGGGLELMLTDSLGAYADGAYYITTKDVVSGVGVITVGGVLKF